MNAVVLGGVARLVARYQPEPTTSTSRAIIASMSRVLGSWWPLEPRFGPSLKWKWGLIFQRIVVSSRGSIKTMRVVGAGSAQGSDAQSTAARSGGVDPAPAGIAPGQIP